MRRSTLARVGLVFFLLLGRSRARKTSARSLSQASSRFRFWSRVRWLVMRSQPSASSEDDASARRRSRAPASRPTMSAKSTRSSTLLATLFTFCPPGPPERTAWVSTASAGTMIPGRTTRGEITIEDSRNEGQCSLVTRSDSNGREVADVRGQHSADATPLGNGTHNRVDQTELEGSKARVDVERAHDVD